MVRILVESEIGDQSDVLVPPHEAASQAGREPARRKAGRLIRPGIHDYDGATGIDRPHARGKAINLEGWRGVFFGLRVRQRCQASDDQDEE